LRYSSKVRDPAQNNAFERAALDLFVDAVEQDPDERDAWLAAACHGDAHLQRRVEQLLAADSEHDSGLLINGGSVATVGPETGMTLPPAQIGPYRLQELIGAGGMGSVYRGQRNDGLFDQAVAIKFIRPTRGLVEVEPLIDAERKLLARMEHRGIARILDGGKSAEGLHYLVMEFVRGMPLDRFADDHRLGIRERIELLREVCAAVAHAHQNLVLHCDLKPANILVTAEHQTKLIDFGVARIKDAIDTSRPEGYTQGYTSPQRLAGESAVVADDIYALGIVIRELVSGTVTPGTAGTVPPLDRELAALVAKATAFERDDRYSSVGALDDDLRAWLECRPVLAVGGDWRYRLRKLIARHPWRVAGLASTLTALVIGSGVIALLYVRSEQARASAEKRFNEVRDLSKFMMFDLYDRLDGMPRSLSLRRDVADLSQQYLSRLAADASAPAPLQIETLEGLLRLAAVQGSKAGSRLGQVDEARRNLTTADALAARLQATGISVWRLAHLRARIFLQQARINADVDDDTDKTESNLNAARDQLNRALAQAPGDSGLQWTDADWYTAYAELRLWQGRYAEARSVAQKARLTVAAFPAQQRASRESRLFGAKIADVIAEAQYYSGDAIGAEQSYAEELDDLERTSTQLAPDRTIARYRVRAQWALGETYLSNHQNAEALSLTRTALEGATELSVEDPADADARRLRSVTQFAHAQALAADGQIAKAIGSFTDIIAARRAASLEEPHNVGLARDYAIALFAAGDIYAFAHRAASACTQYDLGIAVFDVIQREGSLMQLDRDHSISDARKQRASLNCSSGAAAP
jgi:serine/threonine-protein kinase